MSAINWTKISNNLADSSDWAYISSEIKKELGLDIDPAFSMYVFEEYLKLAHKKNNPCVKEAEFISRTFNTKHLFFATNNLDYETFDKLIKFINKQFIEVKKLNKKYEIVKFNDYYNDDKKNVNKCHQMSATMSSNVSNDVSNMSAKKNNDILMTKRRLQNKLAQAKRRLKMGLGSQSNLEKIKVEYDAFMSSMSSMSANVSNVSADVINDVSKCHGGDRGGDITCYIVKNKEKEIEGGVTLSAMSANQKDKCQQKMSSTPTPSFLKKGNQKQRNNFDEREFIKDLRELDDKRCDFLNVRNKFVCMDINKLNYWIKHLDDIATFAQPITKIDFSKVEEQFNGIFELLDKNTSTPYIENATAQERKERKQEMLLEIYEEAKTNPSCSLCMVYNFLLKYYGKKKDNGYNFDCPTYCDLRAFITDNQRGLKSFILNTNEYTKYLQERIKILEQQQQSKQENKKEVITGCV